MSTPTLVLPVLRSRHITKTVAVQWSSDAAGFQRIGRIAWRRNSEDLLELRHDPILDSVSDVRMIEELERSVAL